MTDDELEVIVTGNGCLGVVLIQIREYLYSGKKLDILEAISIYSDLVKEFDYQKNFVWGPRRPNQNIS